MQHTQHRHSPVTQMAHNDFVQTILGLPRPFCVTELSSSRLKISAWRPHTILMIGSALNQRVQCYNQLASCSMEHFIERSIERFSGCFKIDRVHWVIGLIISLNTIAPTLAAIRWRVLVPFINLQFQNDKYFLFAAAIVALLCLSLKVFFGKLLN